MGNHLGKKGTLNFMTALEKQSKGGKKSHIKTSNNNRSYITRPSSSGLSGKTQKRGRKEDEATSEEHRPKHVVAVYILMKVSSTSSFIQPCLFPS